MSTQHLISFVGLLISALTSAFGSNASALTLELAPDEKAWVGVIHDGHQMPFSVPYAFDMFGQNRSNQVQPLILTNKGQYVWSEEPYRFEITGQRISVSNTHGKLHSGRHGTNLRQVQQFARENFILPSGKIPDAMLFTAPQYNTWIELTYNQNQAAILAYARAINEHGLPVGVLMIDDTWQEDYGLWKFHPGRFPEPKKMMEELHAMGFKVMLWVCPFVSADQFSVMEKLKRQKALLEEDYFDALSQKTLRRPAMVSWWNGISAQLDFSNPKASRWLETQLDHLVQEYGVDGFKLDAGDFNFYPVNAITTQPITPNEQCRRFNEIGLKYPLNEYRAAWKMGGQPLAQRLADKRHAWSDLEKLIPQMTLLNLMGYTFSCPDMIGGGEFRSFLNADKIDQELFVRSAQCHALMPMMQFSAAPWRVLDQEHFDAVKKAVEIRQRNVPYLMQLVEESRKTNAPIVRSMEYEFPGLGYFDVKDQFMLGSRLLVAPVLSKGKSRTVILPPGKWTDDQGAKHEGGKLISIEVPLDRLPIFELEI